MSASFVALALSYCMGRATLSLRGAKKRPWLEIRRRETDLTYLNHQLKMLHRAHDGKLAGRPGDIVVGSNVFRRHDVVGAPVGLAHHDGEEGHGDIGADHEHPGGVADPFGDGSDLPGDEDWYVFRAPKIGSFRLEVHFDPIAALPGGGVGAQQRQPDRQGPRRLPPARQARSHVQSRHAPEQEQSSGQAQRGSEAGVAGGERQLLAECEYPAPRSSDWVHWSDSRRQYACARQ